MQDTAAERSVSEIANLFSADGHQDTDDDLGDEHSQQQQRVLSIRMKTRNVYSVCRNHTITINYKYKLDDDNI